MRKDIGVMKKLIAKKGFTLVECVIAIAVFAVMAGMILFIVGNAVTTSKKAREQEKNMNGLVDNIVQDQSPKRYGEYDSDVLNMKFSYNGTNGKDFSMTYSTIDGYKNYVQCPICAYHGKGGLFTIQDFMTVAAHASTQYQDEFSANSSVDTLYKPSHWFDPTTMYMQCPDCGTVINGDSETAYSIPGVSSPAKYPGTDEVVHNTIRFRCLSCTNEGDYFDCSSLEAPDSSTSFIFSIENFAR